MAHWRWDSSFSVGIELIDKQHQQLIEYINALNVAYAYKKDYMVEKVLNQLIEYTKSHFSFEEALMEEAGYPLTQQHKDVHNAFIERIEFFKERYDGGENVAKQLMQDLQLWLINHIQHEDKDYKVLVQKLFLKNEVSIDIADKTNNRWLRTLLDKFF